MKLIKIGEEYFNLDAVVKISRSTVEADGETIESATLHFQEKGRDLLIAASDLEKIFELTGNTAPPEFQTLSPDWTISRR